MGGDNKDRYGRRHRNDEAFDVGDSKPGDVGDSQGTFHDRARQNSNVIVDGAVRSHESHKRSSVETNGSQEVPNESTESRYDESNSHTESVSQSDIAGKVVEVTIDSVGGTLDTMAEYKNHQVHIEGGSPGEKIRVKLEDEQGYMVGERVRVKE